MYNQDNTRDVDVFPDELSTQKKTKNQAQIKIDIAKCLKTYLNDLNKYCMTYQVFEIHIAILESFVNTDELN